MSITAVPRESADVPSEWQQDALASFSTDPSVHAQAPRQILRNFVAVHTKPSDITLGFGDINKYGSTGAWKYSQRGHDAIVIDGTAPQHYIEFGARDCCGCSGDKERRLD